MHDGKIFRTVSVKVKVTWVRSLLNMWPHAGSIDSDSVNGREQKSPYEESLGPREGVTESEFLISFQGFGHVTPNLGYLAKSAKCKLHFLECEMSSGDETRYVCRGR